MPRRPVLPILATLVLAAAASAWGHAGIAALEDAARDEVARQPGDPGAHLHEALVHEVAHEWDAALVALAEAAERGADPDQVAVVRGRVFLAAGWPRMARREFDCLLARRPDAFGALYERGRAWMQLGNPEEAARDFGRAVAGLPRPTPEHVFAHRDALLAAGHREDAVRALDAGMAHVGPAVSLQLAAIDLEEALGRHDDALRRLAELIAQNPHNEAWLARRGDILERAGRRDEAHVAYTTALALIEARPPHRRPKPLEDLAHRLRAATAPPHPEDIP